MHQCWRLNLEGNLHSAVRQADLRDIRRKAMGSKLGRIIHPLLAGLMLLMLIGPALCLVDISLCESEWLINLCTWSGYYSDHYLISLYFIWYSLYISAETLYSAFADLSLFPFGLAWLGSAVYSLGFTCLIILGLSRALSVRRWLTRLHVASIGATLASVPATICCWQGGLFAGFWMSVGLVTAAGLTELVLYVISRLGSIQG